AGRATTGTSGRFRPERPQRQNVRPGQPPAPDVPARIPAACAGAHPPPRFPLPSRLAPRPEHPEQTMNTGAILFERPELEAYAASALYARKPCPATGPERHRFALPG